MNKLFFITILMFASKLYAQNEVYIGTDPARNFLPLALGYNGFTANLIGRTVEIFPKDSIKTNNEYQIGFANFTKMGVNKFDENFDQTNKGLYFTYSKIGSRGNGWSVTFTHSIQNTTYNFYDNQFNKDVKIKLKSESIVGFGAGFIKDFMPKVGEKLKLYPRIGVSASISTQPDDAPYSIYLPGLELQTPKIIFFNIGVNISCPIFYLIPGKIK